MMQRPRPLHAKSSATERWLTTHLPLPGIRAARTKHREGLGESGRVAGKRRLAFIGATIASLVAGSLVVLTPSVASANLAASFTPPSQAPNPIIPGKTAIYSPITATRTASPPAFATLGASGLPSGATFSDSDGCVPVSGNTFTFTGAQVTTTAGVSPTTSSGASFTLTVTGYSNSGCTTAAGGTSTGTATLIVAATASPAWNNGSLTCGTANNATLPTGTTAVVATLLGGGGGGGGAGTSSTSGTNNTHSFGGNGAPGGSAAVTYPVTSGSIYVDVGCGGGGGVGDAATASGGTAAPGYTPGGAGGAGSGYSTGSNYLGAAGGAGGGSTAVCTGSSSCSALIAITAGGGGGGAGCGYNGVSNDCTGASGASGGAGGSTDSAAGAGGGGSTNGGTGTAGGTGLDGSANTGGSSGESSGSGFGGSGGGAGVREGTSSHDVGGPGGGGGGGTGGNGALNNGSSPANNGIAGSGGANNGPGTGGNTGIASSTTEGATGTGSGTSAAGNGGAGGTTTAGGTGSSGSQAVNMGGGGGGAGWTGGGGGGPNYTVSTSSQFSAGGGGGGSSWATATASPTFSPVTGGPASSCGQGDSSNSTGLSSGVGGYGDGQPTSGAAGTGDAGCPGNVTLTFAGFVPATPTESGSLTVTAGGSLSASFTSANTVSYAESGLPADVTFNTSTGALTGTPTVAGSFPFTVTASNGFGNSSAYSGTLIVNPATFNGFSLSPSTSSPTAGTAFTVSVTAQDQYSNTVMSYAGTECLTFSGPASSPAPSSTAPVYPVKGTCSNGSAVTFSSGVASGVNAPSITLYDAQSVTLTATDNPTSKTGTTALTVAAAPAQSVAVSSGSSQSATVGTAFSSALAAIVKDTYSNPVSGNSVTFAAPSTGASGTFATGGNCSSSPQTYQCVATTNTSGIATSSTLTANTTAGAGYTVTATATGVGTAANFTETNLVGSVNKLVFSTVPTGNQTASATATIGAYQVQEQDSFGNPVTAGSTITVNLGTNSLGTTGNTPFSLSRRVGPSERPR